MSPRDALQGVTEPEFLISSQGLGYVTPNLEIDKIIFVAVSRVTISVCVCCFLYTC